MGRMSDLHAETATGRADEAEHEAAYWRERAGELGRLLVARDRTIAELRSELAMWERKAAHRCIDAYCPLCDGPRDEDDRC